MQKDIWQGHQDNCDTNNNLIIEETTQPCLMSMSYPRDYESIKCREII